MPQCSFPKADVGGGVQHFGIVDDRKADFPDIRCGCAKVGFASYGALSHLGTLSIERPCERYLVDPEGIERVASILGFPVTKCVRSNL